MKRNQKMPLRGLTSGRLSSRTSRSPNQSLWEFKAFEHKLLDYCFSYVTKESNLMIPSVATTRMLNILV